MGDVDKAYKNIFTHAQVVRELLQSFVKESWIDQVNFSTLTRCNGSYVSEDLRERIDDVIWKVKWQGKDLYLYILLELQSTVDKYMSVRIMTYIGLLYQDIIKSGTITGKQPLPPILPIVLYNGKQKWTAKHSIQELVQTPPRGFDKFIPKVEYLLIDEVRTNLSELNQLDNCISAIFRLEKCKDHKSLVNMLTQLQDWMKLPKQDSIRRAIATWLIRVIMPENFNTEEETNTINMEDITMLAETVKKWPKQWLQEGIKKGVIRVARNLFKKNYSLEEIARLTDLSVKELKKIFATCEPKAQSTKPKSKRSKKRK